MAKTKDPHQGRELAAADALEAELAAQVVRQDRVLRDVERALLDAQTRHADVLQKIRQLEDGDNPDSALEFEARLQAAMSDQDAQQALTQQETGLRARVAELTKLRDEAVSRREHSVGQLRNARAATMATEWRSAVQAVVDALTLVHRAPAVAEGLRRDLRDQGLTRVHASVLDTFSLGGMPVKLDPWGKFAHVEGLPVTKFLQRAEGIGCDMERLRDEIAASRTRAGAA
jgi:hypothetical protein